MSKCLCYMYMSKNSQALNEDGIEKCRNAFELKCDWLTKSVH